MTAIQGLGKCWRRAERVGDLQVTWHDATPNNSRHQRDDSRPGVHAVVVGRIRPHSRLINDCSGGKVKPVDEISSLYTKSATEAETTYLAALADAQSRRVDKGRPGV